MASTFKEIGVRLKDYMQHRGLTINKLATATHLPAKKIAKIIDGKNFSLKKVLLIMEVLSDINQVWLMTGAGDMLNHNTNQPDKTKNNPPRQTKAVPNNLANILNQVTEMQQKLLKQNKKIIALLKEQSAEKQKTRKKSKRATAEE